MDTLSHNFAIILSLGITREKKRTDPQILKLRSDFNIFLADKPWENLLKNWIVPLWWEWTGNRVRLSVICIKGIYFYLYFEKEVFTF